MIFAIVLGLVTQGYVNRAFKRWSRVALATQRTGAQVARIMLDSEGLNDVRIEQVAGNLSDHFDPRSNVLRLSPAVYGEATVAAAGVAAHEAGHAVQHARGFLAARIRSALVPAANLGSNGAWVLIILGLITGVAGIAWLGILLFAMAVLFQVVTLPVEFDASKRALASLSTTGMLPPEQVAGARNVLTAAALTYVAATLISVMQLFYWIGAVGRD
jgi:Zn-dependent membrane protease YugP